MEDEYDSQDDIFDVVSTRGGNNSNESVLTPIMKKNKKEAAKRKTKNKNKNKEANKKSNKKKDKQEKKKKSNVIWDTYIYTELNTFLECLCARINAQTSAFVNVLFFVFVIFFDNRSKNTGNKLPNNFLAGYDELVEETPLKNDWSSAGFYVLENYNGEKWVQDWKQYCICVGDCNDWYEVDYFLHNKIIRNASNFEVNFSMSDWKRNNLFVRQVQYYSNEEFYTNDVIVELGYWEYRDSFYTVAKQMGAVSNEFNWCKIPLKNIIKITDEAKIDQCADIQEKDKKIDKWYDDYDVPKWEKAVREHNAKLKSQREQESLKKNSKLVTNNKKKSKKNKKDNKKEKTKEKRKNKTKEKTKTKSKSKKNTKAASNIQDKRKVNKKRKAESATPERPLKRRKKEHKGMTLRSASKNQQSSSNSNSNSNSNVTKTKSKNKFVKSTIDFDATNLLSNSDSNNDSDNSNGNSNASKSTEASSDSKNASNAGNSGSQSGDSGGSQSGDSSGSQSGSDSDTNESEDSQSHDNAGSGTSTETENQDQVMETRDESPEAKADTVENETDKGDGKAHMQKKEANEQSGDEEEDDVEYETDSESQSESENNTKKEVTPPNSIWKPKGHTKTQEKDEQLPEKFLVLYDSQPDSKAQNAGELAIGAKRTLVSHTVGYAMVMHPEYYFGSGINTINIKWRDFNMRLVISSPNAYSRCIRVAFQVPRDWSCDMTGDVDSEYDVVFAFEQIFERKYNKPLNLKGNSLYINEAKGSGARKVQVPPHKAGMFWLMLLQEFKQHQTVRRIIYEMMVEQGVYDIPFVKARDCMNNYACAISPGKDTSHIIYELWVSMSFSILSNIEREIIDVKNGKIVKDTQLGLKPSVKTRLEESVGFVDAYGNESKLEEGWWIDVEEAQKLCKKMRKKFAKKYAKIIKAKEDEWFGYTGNQREIYLNKYDMSAGKWQVAKQNKAKKQSKDISQNLQFTQGDFSNANKSPSMKRTVTKLPTKPLKDANLLTYLTPSCIANLSNEDTAACLKIYESFCSSILLNLFHGPCVSDMSLDLNGPNCRSRFSARSKFTMYLFFVYLKIHICIPMESFKSLKESDPIKTHIMNGFTGFSKLTKDELTKLFGVSKQPIRNRFVNLANDELILCLMGHENSRQCSNWVEQVIQRIIETNSFDLYVEKIMSPWTQSLLTRTIYDAKALEDIYTISEDEGLKPLKMIEYFAKRVLVEWANDQNSDPRIIVDFLDAMRYIASKHDLLTCAKSLLMFEHEFNIEIQRNKEFFQRFRSQHKATVWIDLVDVVYMYEHLCYTLQLLSTFNAKKLLSNIQISRYWVTMILYICAGFIECSFRMDSILDLLVAIVRLILKHKSACSRIGHSIPAHKLEKFMVGYQRYQVYTRVLCYRHGRLAIPDLGPGSWTETEYATKYVFDNLVKYDKFDATDVEYFISQNLIHYYRLKNLAKPESDAKTKALEAKVRQFKRKNQQNRRSYTQLRTLSQINASARAHSEINEHLQHENDNYNHNNNNSKDKPKFNNNNNNNNNNNSNNNVITEPAPLSSERGDDQASHSLLSGNAHLPGIPEIPPVPPPVQCDDNHENADDSNVTTDSQLSQRSQHFLNDGKQADDDDADDEQQDDEYDSDDEEQDDDIALIEKSKDVKQNDDTKVSDEEMIDILSKLGAGDNKSIDLEAVNNTVKSINASDSDKKSKYALNTASQEAQKEQNNESKSNDMKVDTSTNDSNKNVSNSSNNNNTCDNNSSSVESGEILLTSAEAERMNPPLHAPSRAVVINNVPKWDQSTPNVKILQILCHKKQGPVTKLFDSMYWDWNSEGNYFNNMTRGNGHTFIGKDGKNRDVNEGSTLYVISDRKKRESVTLESIDAKVANGNHIANVTFSGSNTVEKMSTKCLSLAPTAPFVWLHDGKEIYPQPGQKVTIVAYGRTYSKDLIFNYFSPNAIFNLVQWYTDETGRWIAIIGIPICKVRNRSKKFASIFLAVPVSELKYYEAPTVSSDTYFKDLKLACPNHIAKECIRMKEEKKHKIYAGNDNTLSLSVSFMRKWIVQHKQNPKSKYKQSTTGNNNKNKFKSKQKNNGKGKKIRSINKGKSPSKESR